MPRTLTPEEKAEILNAMTPEERAIVNYYGGLQAVIDDTVEVETTAEDGTTERILIPQICLGRLPTLPEPIRVENNRYNARVYYTRVGKVVNELPPEHPDVHYTTCLHGIELKVPDIREAFNQVKEIIHNPTDEMFIKVLDDWFIPYKLIEWDENYYQRTPEAQAASEKFGEGKPLYSCNSKTLKSANGDTWVLQITIKTLEGEEPTHLF